MYRIKSRIENARSAKIHWFERDDYSEVKITVKKESGREQDTGLYVNDFKMYDPYASILNVSECRIKFYYSEDNENLILLNELLAELDNAYYGHDYY